MKPLKVVFFTLILIYLLAGRLIAQDINVHNMIGKKISDVVKLYGNPVHQDNSNPDMICVFYKGDNGTMTFVSDKDGIYQAEVYKSYSDEKAARSETDKMISKSISNGFVCDTVSINDFQLTKPGVQATLQLNKNKITHNMDVSVKAKEFGG
jgi:hypothetical protein